MLIIQIKKIKNWLQVNMINAQNIHKMHLEHYIFSTNLLSNLIGI